MKKVLIFLSIIFFLLSFQNKAEASIFNGKTNEHFILLDTLTNELSITKHAFYFADTANLLVATDLKNIPWKKFNKTPTFQPSNTSHWFKLVIKNPYSKNINKVLFVPYTSIYLIDIYIETNDTLIKLIETGVSRSVQKKENKTTGYPVAIKFNAKTQSTLYVKFKHVYRPLRTTMYLFSEKRFSEIKYRSHSLLWFWRGIYSFAIIVSIIAYYFLKQKSFLYYSLLNAGVSLYVFSHTGEIPLLLGSDPTDISSSIDYIGAFFINLFLTLFLNSLTPIKENNHRIWKLMMALIYGIIPFILLSFIPSFRLNFITLIIHNYIMIVSGIVLILQVYFLIQNTIHKRENGLILLLVYTLYIIFSFADIILPNMGVLEDNNYICKRFFVGSFIEVFSFMYLMSKQTLNVYSERSRLIEKQKNHQKEMLFSIVQSQENERNRAGRELHDSIGANMAIIKQKLNIKDTELQKLISQTIDSIRNMSHGLVISNINDSEFMDEIKELCFTASSDKINFHVYFHKWPEIKNAKITTHLYRITQELIQNALKHSKASDAYLQFIGDEIDKVVLMYEDNGIGFDINDKKNRKGLGLKNIQNRVELLNGNLQIESNLHGSGTNAVVEINYNGKTSHRTDIN